MNERYSDDLISAYFDGEVAPDERAQAEQRLAESVDVRRELSEYGQLSGFLASLPREQVPKEFCASIMQAAERATLLPSRDSVPVASKHSLQPKRRFLGVAASVAVAASVLVVVMINWFAHPVPEREVAMQQRAPRVVWKKQTSPMSRDGADRLPVAGADHDRAVSLNEPHVAPAELAKTDAMVNSPSVAAVVVEKEESLAASKAEPERTPARPSQFTFDAKTLSDAAIGEVVEALATADNQIAVVQLTVVDRRKGLESLQLLLARNQIPLETTAAPSNLSANAATESEHLLAVYVETNSSQMSSALRELQQEDLFREVVVQEPIPMASLDTVSQSQLGYTVASSEIGSEGMAMRAAPVRVQRRSRVSKDAPTAEGTSRAAEKTKAKAKAKAKDTGKSFSVAAAPQRALAEARSPKPELRMRKKTPSDGQKSAAPAKPRTESQRASRTRKAARNPQDALASRQLVLSVPVNVLPTRPLTQKRVEQRLSLGVRAGKSAAGRAGEVIQDAARKGETTLATRPLQVLFVLVSNAPM